MTVQLKANSMRLTKRARAALMKQIMYAVAHDLKTKTVDLVIFARGKSLAITLSAPLAAQLANLLLSPPRS